MEERNIKSIHLGEAKCAMDLGDGSERGEYVNQDYILNKLGRPLRAISLMYCYYPLDKGFPERASVAFGSPDVNFAWGYPYDDYFTYKGGIGGNTDGEPFCYMREIRAHGQDVILTLTVDPNVPDDMLTKVAQELRTFGRIQLRVNHEATGNWFEFNKRCTYQQVADFFCRFTAIIHKEAPNVSVIACIGGVEDAASGKIEKEEEFAQTVLAADIWSVDKYMALHRGWTYDVAEKGGTSFSRSKVRDVYDFSKRTVKRFTQLNGGVKKPMVLSELNSDGDVTGPYDQVAMLNEFCDLLKNDDENWLSAFTFYQFRDRGRLGLEIEDPNNADVGVEQPILAAYKKLIHDEYFKPAITEGEQLQFPVKMRWGGAEDADGIEIPLNFEKTPVFCEVTFDEPLNLIMEINGKWFYKSPKAKTIDLMPAFFEKPITDGTSLTLKIFAPPASGENDPSQGADWQLNYYSELNKLPDIRIRYAPIVE